MFSSSQYPPLAAVAGGLGQLVIVKVGERVMCGKLYVLWVGGVRLVLWLAVHLLFTVAVSDLSVVCMRGRLGMHFETSVQHSWVRWYADAAPQCR